MPLQAALARHDGLAVEAHRAGRAGEAVLALHGDPLRGVQLPAAIVKWLRMGIAAIGSACDVLLRWCCGAVRGKKRSVPFIHGGI